jgi:hypothetical protein
MIVGMKPADTGKKALLYDLERSARAELKLRHRAIEYYLIRHSLPKAASDPEC